VLLEGEKKKGDTNVQSGRFSGVIDALSLTQNRPLISKRSGEGGIRAREGTGGGERKSQRKQKGCIHVKSNLRRRQRGPGGRATQAEPQRGLGVQ